MVHIDVILVSSGLSNLLTLKLSRKVTHTMYQTYGILNIIYYCDLRIADRESWSNKLRTNDRITEHLLLLLEFATP